MRAIQLGLMNAVSSSTRSLSILLSAVEMSLRKRTTRDSLMSFGGNYQYARLCTVYTGHGCYLRAVFISLGARKCAATIHDQGWQLFEGGNYLRAASNQRNTLLTNHGLFSYKVTLKLQGVETDIYSHISSNSHHTP